MLTTLTPKTPTSVWLNDSRRTLSPSAVSAYEICGKRGQYYQDPNIPRRPSLATAVGSAWHAGIEAVTTGEAPEVQLGVVVAEKFNEIVRSPNFSLREGETFEQGAAEIETLVASYHQRDSGGKWTQPEIEVVAVEVEVFADFGSPHHIFHGVIDKIVNVDGSLIGVDEKTAGRRYSGAKAAGDPRHLPQAPLYAEAWSLEYEQEIDHFAYDVTTKNKGEFSRIWVPTSKLAREPFVQRWRDLSTTVALHEERGLSMPTNPQSFLCSDKWCDYYDRCPMGKAIEVHLIPQP